MRLVLDTFPHPLKVVITVVLASALCGWFAADPWAALRFWPGVLMGALGANVGWSTLRVRSAPHAERRFKFFAIVLLGWFALAFVPQRDIPVIGAPFGVWLALTMAMALDWRRARA